MEGIYLSLPSLFERGETLSQAHSLIIGRAISVLSFTVKPLLRSFSFFNYSFTLYVNSIQSLLPELTPRGKRCLCPLARVELLFSVLSGTVNWLGNLNSVSDLSPYLILVIVWVILFLNSKSGKLLISSAELLIVLWFFLRSYFFFP